MSRHKIEEYISKGESEKGIEMLMNEEIGNYDSYRQAEIILLASRFNNLRKKNHLGLLTSEEHQTERNKLNLDLLHFIKHSGLKKAVDEVDDSAIRFSPTSIEGMKVGNYEILKFVGAGGFGNVYMARQIHLHSTYAIKISHEIKVGKRYLDNIVSSGIRGLKALKHPNIITVYDVGEVEVEHSPRIYMVMDFINGGTLDDWPKSQLSKEEINQRIETFRKVCLGIEAAHNLIHKNEFGFEVHGLYHGDIKPQNILIDEKNEPVIIDFMFVDMNSLYEIIVNRPHEINRSTAVFGTPGYMPFEQEQNGMVNRQTDVYSLGILLFELFSSIRFDEFEDKRIAIIAQHLKAENPHIPSYVSKIVHEATKENPKERLATVSQLLEKLEADKSSWWKKLLKK